MSRSKIAAVLSVLSLALLIAVGCTEKGTGTGGQDGGVGSVQLILGTDTLRFLPGDSASTTVTVVVSDDQGRAISGQAVEISLVDANLGFIEYVDANLRDTTNSQGRVEAIYRTFGQSGDNTISATAGGRSDSQNIAIRRSDAVVATLTIDISPQNMQVSPLTEDSALVTVRIADVDANAIVGINLPLSANGGRLSQLPATDAAGIARTWWYSNGDFGVFQISTRAGGLVDTTQIQVSELPTIPGTLDVTVDRLQIRADGCVTRATVRAVLKDAFGSAVVNDTVKFGTFGPVGEGSGSTQNAALTDSFGAAIVEFCEYGIPSETDSASIVARYVPWGLYDTARVWIAEASDIGTISLSATSLSGTAGIDSVALNIFAQFEDLTPVHGYWAHFRSDPCGDFTRDSVLLLNGQADTTSYYKMCLQIPAVLPDVWVEVNGVQSNHLNFTVNPGPATRVDVTAPTTANLNQVVQVVATVADSFNNRVASGQAVTFTASFGSIQGLGQTDAFGQATVNFNPGTTAGQALVRASVNAIADSTVITIISGAANSITLSVSNTSLEVSGTGGQDWSQLQAHVYDANGNPVLDGTWVEFCILNAPQGGGANINDHGTCDSAQTSSGTATVTLNAGVMQGPLSFEACIDVSGTPQCASYSGITIVAGPPFQIYIYPDEIGIDAIGGAWDLEVAVLVVDLFQNPVRDGVAVFMEVQPDSAQIVSNNVSTGNSDVNGDSRPGLAYTTLRFLSPNTFDVITILASTANGVTGERGFTLPIQEPIVEVRCQPGQWHFPSQGDPCQIRCDAEVQDGHGVSIAGATVFYTTTRGRLHATNNVTAPIASFAITTVQSPGNIWATLWLVDMAANIFPDPLIAEIPGDCSVEVSGYADATDSQTINFRRGGG